MHLTSSAGKPGRTTLLPLLGCALVLLGAILPPDCPAASDVTAHYSRSHGKRLAITVAIPSHPPASLILVQRLPAGVRIVDANPPADSVNSSAGEAKWLLHDLTPGTLSIRMTLDQEVSAGDISAEIRYMDDRGGRMRSFRVKIP